MKAAGAFLACVMWASPAVATAQGTRPAHVASETREHAGQRHQHPHADSPQEPAHAGHADRERDDDDTTTTGSVRPLTDTDRAAASGDVQGHTVHDNVVNYFVLVDQLEWQRGGGLSGVNWENVGWIGFDRNRFWFRTEGEGEDGRLETAHVHALYGRAIAPWWDIVVGIRQDVRPGSPQTWAAVGLQGLAPYWFEVEATAYVGPSGRTQLRIETEYELLLTNRAILQPIVDVEVHGKDDPRRGIGRGLSSAEAGLRLRYEIRREIAPYLGVTWSRMLFGTADRARAAGERTGGVRLAAGLRFWL